MIGLPTVRFWAKVDKNGPYHPKLKTKCWQWIASITAKEGLGYGQFWDGQAIVTAPRYAWEQCIGPVPGGLWVLHKCDNRRCVNPKHLFLGKAKDNTHDMMRKRRHGSITCPGIHRGSKNGHATVTEFDVRIIRGLYRRGLFTLKQLGNRYGVRNTTIQMITSRQTWQHVK